VVITLEILARFHAYLVVWGLMRLGVKSRMFALCQILLAFGFCAIPVVCYYLECRLETKREKSKRDGKGV
jgi:hypothetical protein